MQIAPMDGISQHPPSGFSETQSTNSFAVENPEDLDVLTRLRLLRQTGDFSAEESAVGQDGLVPFDDADFGLAADSWGSIGGLDLGRNGRNDDVFGSGGGGGGGGGEAATGNTLSYNSLYSELNAELERDSKGLMLLKTQNSAVRID